jgi:peroxiredoxin
MISSILCLLLSGQSSPSLNLHLLPTGAMSKVGFYLPQRLPLTQTPPNGVKALSGANVEYGTWSFGGHNVSVAEVSENGAPSKIVFDFAGKGNLDSSASFAWKARSMNPKDPNALNLYQADVAAPSPFGGKNTVRVKFYRFDPRDKARVAFKDTLLYYTDYVLDGTITLDGKSYHADVLDSNGLGQFDAPSKPGQPFPSSLLVIDRDGDGKFNQDFEWYDSKKPFNIGGTTYELSSLRGDGSRAAIRRSGKMVAEIPVPVSLRPGAKAIAFTAKDVNGNTVHFPQDFKGKIVLLDFWATWCGPCMGEVPNVVRTYNQLHANGFEILGISLDNKDTLKDLAPVTKDKGMTWDQVADGKFWDAEIAKLYGVRAIPAAYIVDGDTGQIYAEGEAIRGENFLPAVQKALASKGKSPK